MKAQIALDAIKGKITIIGLAYEYGVHPIQISICKKQLFNAALAAFSNRKDTKKKDVVVDHLYQKFSQLKIEVDRLK